MQFLKDCHAPPPPALRRQHMQYAHYKSIHQKRSDNVQKFK